MRVLKQERQSWRQMKFSLTKGTTSLLWEKKSNSKNVPSLTYLQTGEVINKECNILKTGFRISCWDIIFTFHSFVNLHYIFPNFCSHLHKRESKHTQGEAVQPRRNCRVKINTEENMTKNTESLEERCSKESETSQPLKVRAGGI